MRYLFLMILLWSSSVLYAADKMRIAVLDFQANDVSIYAAKAVSDIITTEMAKKDDFIMVERSQMSSIMSEQGFQQSGCIDSACAVQLGKLLSAKKILIGSLSRLGDVFTITGKVVDIQTARIELADSERCLKEDDLDQAARILSVKLINRIAGKSYPLPSRTYETEEARLRFFVSAGYSYNWQGGMNIPIVKGTGIASEKSDFTYMNRFSVSPGYELTDIITLKSSLEFAFFNTGFTEAASNYNYIETDDYVLYQDLNYLDARSYAAKVWGFSIDVLFNYRITGFTPFCALGAGYSRYNFYGKGIISDTYILSKADNSIYKEVQYKLKAEPANVFVGRAYIGISISISRYVDFILSGGVTVTLNSPVINGTKISKYYEGSNGDISGLPQEYDNLDQILNDSAADYKGDRYVVGPYTQGEFNFRIF